MTFLKNGSTLCRDEVQTVSGRQIQSIADYSGTRIERSIHLDLRQQFLTPAGTKNGHKASSVPNVKPIARQQKASPDRIVGLVLPQLDTGCRVQTMNGSAQVPNVQQTILHNRRSYYAAYLARSPH